MAYVKKAAEVPQKKEVHPDRKRELDRREPFKNVKSATIQYRIEPGSTTPVSSIIIVGSK